jgi:Na+-translocating ferredoxin:NAD+ oxidoreductase RnfG subunit
MKAINWTTVLVALIAAIGGALPATIIASRTHDAVNSRMDALLKEIRKAAIAEGKATEQKAQKERDSN